jgi:hypothetical protein
LVSDDEEQEQFTKDRQNRADAGHKVSAFAKAVGRRNRSEDETEDEQDEVTRPGQAACLARRGQT